jgi:WD40 repeat protein
MRPSAPPCDLFVSYAHADNLDGWISAFVRLLQQVRDDKDWRPWQVFLDARAIRGGHDWEQRILQSLRAARVMLALVSPAYFASPWCRREWEEFRRSEQHEGRGDRLFPLYLSTDPDLDAEPRRDDWRKDLARRQYVDLRPFRALRVEGDSSIRGLIERLERDIHDCWLLSTGSATDAAAQAPPQPDHMIDGAARALDWLPADPFSTFLEAKRKHFCGRRWLFDEIDDWRRGEREQALLITGDPGIGKSAIVAELVHRNPDGQVLAYHCCRADTPSTLQPGALVRNLAAQIARRLPDYAEQLASPALRDALQEAACAGDPLKAFEIGVLAPLSRLPAVAANFSYLLVDALDEALAPREGAGGLSIVQLLAAAQKSFPSWLRLVATTRKERAVLERLRGLRARELDAQDPRNLDDIAEFIHQRFQSDLLAERLAESSQPPALVAEQLEARSAGNFLYVQQVLEAVEQGLYRFDQLGALPPGLYGLYLGFFERHFPDEKSYAPVKRVLQIVVAAREPLDREQLAEAAELDAEEGLPAVLRRLASYLPARAGRYSLYHKSLADWLTEPDLAGSLHSVSRQRGRQRLADLGWAAYRRGVRSLSGYALRHLPRHLSETGRWEDLETLLSDLGFLETKAEAGLVFDLAEDFTEAVRQAPAERPRRRLLGLLEEALRRDLHFIARQPEAMFQCLWNSCWWYDCPAAAHHYAAPEGGWPPGGPPWEQPGPKLFSLLESWRAERELRSPGACWLRSLRPPPAHLGTALRAVLVGHEGEVTSVACSGDGQHIVSGGEDRTVRIWNGASGKLLHCLRTPNGPVNGVAVTPDGKRVLAGVGEGFIHSWDVESGQEVFVFRAHLGWVHCLAVSPDGEWAVSGGGDFTLCLWETATGRQRRQLESSEGWVTSVAISPDGRRIASGAGSQGRLVIQDAATGESIADLGSRGTPIRSLAWSPDGRNIACAAGTNVFLLDPATGAVQTFVSDQPLSAVAYFADGDQIVAAAEDGAVRVLDVRSGQERTCLRGHEKRVRGLAVSPDGRWIVSGGQDGTIRQWNTRTGANLVSLLLDEEEVMEVRCSPDGRWVVTVSRQLPTPVFRLWDTASGELLRSLAEERIRGLWFSPDGRRLAAWLDANTVRLLDARTGEEQRRLRPKTAPVKDAVYSSDGRALFVWNQRIEKWDVEQGVREAVFSEHTGLVRGVRPSPDNEMVASWASDGTIRLWDSRTGREKHHWARRSADPANVCFTRDGRVLVCWGQDRTLQVLDTQTGEELASFQDLPGHVLAEDTGDSLAPGSRAYRCDLPNDDLRGPWTVVIVERRDERWVEPDDLETSEKLRLKGHTGRPYFACYSPDERSIVTAAHDETIRVWSATPQGPFRSGEPRACLAGQSGLARRFSWSGDGKLLAAWFSNETIRIWNMKSDSAATVLSCPPYLLALGFGPNESSVAALTANADVLVWDLAGGSAPRSVSLAAVEAAAEPEPPPPWSTDVRGLDTVIQTPRRGQVLARFPVRLSSLSWSGDGRLCIARQENRLFLLRLEGRLPAAEPESGLPAAQARPAWSWLAWLNQSDGDHGAAKRKRFPSSPTQPAENHRATFENCGDPFPLLIPATTIGRDETCDLRLDRTTVSRKHAQVLLEGDGFKIEDLNSRNGTFHNDQQVQGKVALRHGDRIRITDWVLTFDEFQRCLYVRDKAAERRETAP